MHIGIHPAQWLEAAAALCIVQALRNNDCTDEGMLMFSSTWLDCSRMAVEGLPFGIVSAAPNILKLLITPKEPGILWSLIFTAILAQLRKLVLRDGHLLPPAECCSVRGNLVNLPLSQQASHTQCALQLHKTQVVKVLGNKGGIDVDVQHS